MNGRYACYLFAGSCWNDESFYPPAVTIKPKQNMDGMFNKFSWGKPPYIDLAARLKECGCELDFSEATYSTGSMFSYCWVTRLPKIDFSANTYQLDRTFDHMEYLVTLDELVMPTKEITFSNTFRDCKKLKNIVITGTIANSISLADCSPLTRDSILGKAATAEQIAAGKNLCAIGDNIYYGGIFGALKDFSGTTKTATLSLHSNARDRLTEEEKAYAQAKGWTVA